MHYKNLEKYTKAIELYTTDRTISVSELSKKFNVDRTSLSNYMKRQGIEFRHPVKEEYLIGKERYLSGEPIYKICKLLSINEKNFTLFLKKENVSLRFTYKRPNVKFNEHFFDVIDTEEKAYWLGFIFADGANNLNRITIELANKDFEHLEKFIKSIDAENLIVKSRKNRPTCSVSVVNKYICSKLNDYGIVKNKTKYGFILDSIIPNELLRHFIRGYFDGNGYISKDIHKIQSIIVVPNYKIVSFIFNIIKDFGFKLLKENSYYRIVNYKKQNVLQFQDYLYENSSIYLDRKYKRYLLLKQAQDKSSKIGES